MNFLLVHIVKIKFTRNTIPNAITPNTIKPRNLFSFAQKKKNMYNLLIYYILASI